MTEQSVTAEQIRDVGFLNLRGNPGDKTFRDAAESALGQPLPVAPNTITTGDHRIYWLGPDEWLIVLPKKAATAMAAGLADALGECHAAVNDVSGGNVLVRLAGNATEQLFAKGSTLDFHPDVFSVGHCAQSGLGKAAVLFGKLDQAPTFEVIVRRSFAGYVVKWLQHAGHEYGIEFK